MLTVRNGIDGEGKVEGEIVLKRSQSGSFDSIDTLCVKQTAEGKLSRNLHTSMCKSFQVEHRKLKFLAIRVLIY